MSRPSTLLLILVTTVGATYTILIAPGSGSLDVQPYRLVYDAMAAAAILPWLAITIVRPEWRPRSQLLPAVALVIVAFGLSSVTSRIPRLSVEMLGYVILLVEVYLLLVALMRRPQIRAHLERLALVMCVLVATLYLVEVFRAWMVWWNLIGHLAIPPLRPAYLGLLLSPNPLATVVLALGVFGVAAARFRGRAGNVVRVVVVLLALGATFISGSRGAWFGVALGIVAVAVVILARPENRATASALLRSRSAAVALVIGLPLVAVAAALAAMSGRLTFDDGGARAGFTRASLQMLQGSPLTGVGPGTWGPLRASNTIATDPDQYIPHAHSVYVQTLTEFGLVGIVVAVVLVASLGKLLIGAVRSADPSRRRVGFAGLFAVVVLTGQQFADMLMNVPAVVLAVVLPIAWLDATAQPPPTSEATGASRPSPLANVPLIGAAIVTFVILVGLVRIETFAGTAGDGIDAANRQSWPAARDLASEPAKGDPDVNLYHFQLGISAANAGDLATAESEFRRSAMADDYRYAWLNLAALQWRRGDEVGAQTSLEKAERLGLQRTALALAAGWLHQQLGNRDSATADYAIALEGIPTLADDPFWASESGPAGGLAPILAVVGERASPGTMLQIHLVLGEIDLAQADADALRATDPELYPNLVPAWQGDAGAWASLRARASANPRDTIALQWCRLIAAHRGDRQLVADYGVWLAIVSSPDFLLPPIGRIVFDSSEPLGGSILDGYGTLYRRQVPSAQVVDLLPQLVLRDVP